MADNESRTPIIVALIGCTATIFVGVLANWDKVFSYTPRVPAPVAASADRAQAGMEGPVQGGGGASPAEVRADQARQPGAANPPASLAPTAMTSASPGASGSSAAAGTWRDDDGFIYRFTLTGTLVGYTQELAADGAQVGSGRGTIAGRTLTYRYLDDRTGGTGTCRGELAIDGQSIAGRCASGGGGWPFRIERAPG